MTRARPDPPPESGGTSPINRFFAGFPESSFDGPNSNARLNRQTALLNMLDQSGDAIGVSDHQAAIDQLRDIAAKSDGYGPPDSASDWILGPDAVPVFDEVAALWT